MNSEEYSHLKSHIRTLSNKLVSMGSQAKFLEESLSTKNTEIDRLKRCKNYTSNKHLPSRSSMASTQSKKKLPSHVRTPQDSTSTLNRKEGKETSSQTPMSFLNNREHRLFIDKRHSDLVQNQKKDIYS